MTNKESLRKKTDSTALWTDGEVWTVHHGKLLRSPGRPGGPQSLFRLVAEKLPFTALNEVANYLKVEGWQVDGVYIAHDSMGCPRYIGRGNVIGRLRARKSKHPLELEYFSFYLVKEKKHEREVETILIRAAGPLLHFNDKKKRVDISPGNIKDYEAGTQYFERHRKKGKKA